MKRTIIIAVLAASLGLCVSGCTFIEEFAGALLSGPTRFSVNGVEDISSVDVTLPSDASSETVEIWVDYDWSVTAPSGVSWLSVDVSKSKTSDGGYAGTVTVKAEENTDDVPRSATVTVTSGSVVRYINVTQEKRGKIVTDGTVVNVPIEGGVYQLTVSSNVNFDIEKPDNGWLFVNVSTQTKALDDFIIKITVFENTGTEQRSAPVSFVSGELKETVVFVQEGKDPVAGVSVIGLYGLPGGDYVCTGGRDQISCLRTKNPDVSSFRIINQKDCEVMCVDGIPTDIQRGEKCTISVRKVTKEGTELIGEFEVKAVWIADNKVWLKGQDNVYFVVKK